MGNNNFRPIKFRQSLADFPLDVSLGEKRPDWGLSRWGGGGLFFRPPDDEGFLLRGDRRRIVYKGRRRSHRFTILGDTAFEYDCVLNREPESNVILLSMEGAEKYDFFRQPDFVADPFLKGSYAVYKKETLIGEGTGKLCHIHRPEIIDARGRRCWGELAVVGNELRITIPEQWLAEAKYPVIVDPTIGTTTVGSITPAQYTTEYNNMNIIYMFGVNRFLVPEKLGGTCVAYTYLNNFVFGKGNIHPILFDDINGKPRYRRSQNEQFISTSPNFNQTPSWKAANFNVISNVQGGSYIWFGAYAEGFTTNFDYGATYYKNWPYQEYDDETEEIIYESPDFEHDGNEKVYDIKISWYFEFVSQSQNYVRTLTQGVTLTDNRKLTAEYKRLSIQNIRGSTSLKSSVSFFRQCVMTVANNMSLARLPVFIRYLVEPIGIADKQGNCRELNRKCEEAAAVTCTVKRTQGFFRSLADNFTGNDNASFPVLIVRSISETQCNSDTFRQWGNYIRGLLDISGSEAETEHGAEYYRNQKDMVQADGTVFRGLLLFVRIVTGVFVRDYLLRRFLKAREEIILKSPICRVIILDSRID